MEQVISVIIMIAVGAFFAWLEKLSKRKSAKTDRILTDEAAARRRRKTAVMPPVPRPDSPRRNSPAPTLHTPLTNTHPSLPQEGIRVTAEDSAISTAEKPQHHSAAPPIVPPRPSLSDWRRAILYSEILSPKFRTN